MEASLPASRTEISEYAPHLSMLNIPTDKIRDLIGPGGKNIRSITESTGAKIDVNDDGSVHIFAVNGKAAEEALRRVREVTATAEVGKTYLGKVVRIAEFGAFVELFPGTDGLLHISEIAEQRIRSVRDALKEGDQVMVKVLAIEGNKIKLSRKALLREAREKQKPAETASAGQASAADAGK
jgi:polyribonucleotide nucleotidyltransferase